MKRLALFLPMPLLLSACGGGGPTVTAENKSVSEVADAVQDAVKMQPGKWKTDIKVISVDIPGMPKAQADMMAQQMAQAVSSVESCVTPEMAAKPPSEMMGGAGSGCVYDKFAMSGGKLDSAMTCKQPSGGELKAVTSGKFTSTAFELTGESTMTGMPGMAGAVKTKTNITSTRIGECDAAPKAS